MHIGFLLRYVKPIGNVLVVCARVCIRVLILFITVIVGPYVRNVGVEGVQRRSNSNVPY